MKLMLESGFKVILHIPNVDQLTTERASNQPATARLLSIGCTPWIIPSGKFASAGHCLDGSGATVVEFNVPPSLPNGTLQHPGPEDQYSVNVSTKIFTNGGVGNDWGVFEVYPNSITGLMPKQAQNAYWPLVQDLGPDSIRITGYGVDDGAANQTQQTHMTKVKRSLTRKKLSAWVLSGGGDCSGQVLPLHEGIQERTLAHIGSSCKGHFRFVCRRILVLLKSAL